jgi:DNA recombination protein RmuC
LEDRLARKEEDISKINQKYEEKENELVRINAENASLKTDSQNSRQKSEEASAAIQEKTSQNNALQDTINNLKQELSAKTENNKALQEKLSLQKEEIQNIQKNSALEFEKVAAKILQEKSGEFVQTNKTNIEAILKPLGENIDAFKKKVEETYDKESKERFSLENVVKDLVSQTGKISADANNLTAALKGQTKTQGNFGEVILESILQQSGLQEGIEYFSQETIKDEEGKNLRPDVLVKLPDNRTVIIDSKMSLTAYEKFSSAQNPQDKEIFLTEHLSSVKKHIDELSEKSYDNLTDSLDFTMMFVPIEPAYLLAVEHDRNLWSYSYEKRVLLISPTNLIVCLKLINDLWKREKQSKNAQEIVNRGEKLYEKFAAFTKTLEETGVFIGKAQTSYDNAVSQLKEGRGNLISQAIKLKNLGLKSAKTIPQSMLPTDYEDEDSSPALIEPPHIAD